MTAYFAPSALLPDGWADNVRISVGEDGRIAAVEPDAVAAGAVPLGGPVIPGIPNIHSHAFQRAMAGMAERKTAARDSFWTWREQMYRVALAISPEQLQAVATQLFIEMLKGGYTSVAEFHYLHHDTEGQPYADPAELSRRIIEAATEAGIRLTLLPVIYAYAGFGARPLEPGQRRFRSDPESVLVLLERLRPAIEASPLLAAGVAPHSLRAVSTGMLAELPRLFPQGVIHIHVAEQEPEVAASLAATGMRPIQLLGDTVELDRRWCLVHATHATEDELRLIAKSGATVGLCPTTEANLGDGFFGLSSYLGLRGAFAIGSDSNISASPAEELRWLEYGQRLLHQQRCVVAEGSNARALLDAALAGGRQALGQPVARIEAASAADLVVLDPHAAALPGLAGDALLDQFIFAPRGAMVRDVMVGGRWVVTEGRHTLERPAEARFTAAIEALRMDA